MDDIPPRIVRVAQGEMSATFQQDSAGQATLSLSQEMSGTFSKTTLGEILYELLQTDSTIESWTDLSTGASATWTDLQASASESWTDVTR